MKTSTTALWFSILAYFILVVAQPDRTIGANLNTPKPASKDVIGSWIAHDPCGVEFVKIVFRTNQTAVAAFCFANERVDVVKLKWELTGYKINCKTLDRPESAPADFELTWGGCYIRSTVTYSNNAKRSYDLLKETYAFEQLQKANEALAVISDK